MNQQLKDSWNEFKKELTWNNTKIMICIGLPTLICLYGWTFWFHKLALLLDSKPYHNPVTPDQAIISLCIVAGMIAPLWFISTVVPMAFGWLGKVTRFFIDNKTRRLWWDDITYFTRDMPQDQRDKIKEILLPYKSKEQLRKERRANQSWLRRTFT